MITQTETLSLPLPYPLDTLAPLEDFLIFDIETTGFSASRSMLYMIGVMYFKDDSWHIIQWFANRPDTEPEVLQSFFHFARNYRYLLHFNGDTFDLPFLKKRSSLLHISGYQKLPESFDLFKKFRPLKNLLKLSSMTLKSLEQFISHTRQDIMSGGDLIPVYKEYVMKHEFALQELLLLHNREDLTGTLALLGLLPYTDLLNGHFELTGIHTEDIGDGKFDVIFDIRLPHAMPRPISACLPCGYLSGQDTMCRLLVHGITDTLKHFFPDYKDYYYLPAEDTAIHKSVASYVDKAHRIKARASTCYCKKTGTFLPVSGKTDLPVFYTEYGSKPPYIEYTPAFSKDTNALLVYITRLLTVKK